MAKIHRFSFKIALLGDTLVFLSQSLNRDNVTFKDGSDRGLIYTTSNNRFTISSMNIAQISSLAISPEDHTVKGSIFLHGEAQDCNRRADVTYLPGCTSSKQEVYENVERELIFFEILKALREFAMLYNWKDNMDIVYPKTEVVRLGKNLMAEEVYDAE